MQFIAWLVIFLSCVLNFIANANQLTHMFLLLVTDNLKKYK